MEHEFKKKKVADMLEDVSEPELELIFQFVRNLLRKRRLTPLRR